MKLSLLIVAVVVAAPMAALAQGAPTYPIAGVNPAQRPEGAPVIREPQRGADWSNVFHHGVAKPYPPHLAAADTGSWYTPFNHPGMTGPYDIRDWHPDRKPVRRRR